MNLSPTPKFATATSQRVWEDYLTTIDEARALVLNSRWADDPVGCAQAQYLIQMLQAFGFSVYMAPRQRYPHFYMQTIFLPFESGFGAPCPDFHYRWTFVDGSKTYRLKGKVGSTRWLELQAQRGFWGDANQSNLGTWDFDDFNIAADGSFEIIASPKRHDGNWIELDPAAPNITVMLREAWYDWENEKGIDIHIECLDRDANEPVALSQAEVERRVKAIGFLTKFSVDFFLKLVDRILAEGGDKNTFWAENMAETKNVGGNPRAVYPKIVFELEEDEAIICESEIPNARFWSVQVADPFFQTVDYAYHQSSLNGHQAQLDADGKARIVIARKDPGVPNWIDTVDNGTGVFQWRWYVADRHPMPTARKVKLAELREHLPADTPVVTPAQRREIIHRRAKAVLRRFGI
ncbi:DUF1214 domain-containing protein [Terricaulis silvestris]|uniref:DUF1214 domain-containing protein n=1 Tax=Terricaulis silvestris TaxID=2686094 RepID=A0A6I6MPR5_9CAUL|nr:DUF1214 domain-containing protein [Terricaulis silvestris]QGZ96151.1 hypothetical protein DSM104635_03009 [Terricaulis silvestris]